MNKILAGLLCLSAVADAAAPSLAVDPMGAAGAATPLAPIAPPGEKAAKKPKAEDTDAPRRKSVVSAIFAEAAKTSHKDKDGNPLTGDALKKAQVEVAIKQLLVKSEGKDGLKLKPSDFGEAEGGKKSYYMVRKTFYLARAQECQDKIDGKSSATPEAIAKKIGKAQDELAKLVAQLKAAGIDPAEMGLSLLPKA